MKTFADLKFEPNLKGFVGGIKALMTFDNGYGVSVIQNEFSHGGDKGLYELAMTSINGDIIYCEITNNDVCGYLTPDDVTRLMIKIQKIDHRAYDYVYYNGEWISII